MSVLELFSGTRSVGKVCDEIGFKSVSVDLILDAVDSISGENADGQFIVNDREQIAEFLNNVDSSVGKSIEAKISEINAIGIAQ